ncbi:MAG: preprotein translocase subunit SecG [Candidatus Pacebacteria bacterium]|nr:preprotein translocase subunit SecG [Candidatus Paceibacterota bacterium]MDD4074140.1 preprotein translocase subunit SecG [Candidatus Paceibacterota bacterium]
MNNSLLIAQIVISILLVILILLQQRGTALGSAFGGGGEVYSTRRGIQKKLMYATVVLTIAFLVIAVLNLLS